MRKLLIAIMVFWVLPIFAQNDSTAVQTESEKVDLNELVREQIELAQAKQEMETITASEKQIEATVRQPHVVRRIKIEKNNSGFFWKIIVIAAASAVVFGVVYFKRKMSVVKNSGGKKLKRNIQFLREERVMRKENPNMKQIRFSLIENTGKGELSEEAVTNAARKLRISREEIILANRINSFKMMNA